MGRCLSPNMMKERERVRKRENWRDIALLGVFVEREGEERALLLSVLFSVVEVGLCWKYIYLYKELECI